jgi:hypothetical protein
VLDSQRLGDVRAVWRYSAASARRIFGDSLGDPTADEIRAAARGATRTEVSEMVSRKEAA